MEFTRGRKNFLLETSAVSVRSFLLICHTFKRNQSHLYVGIKKWATASVLLRVENWMRLIVVEGGRLRSKASNNVRSKIRSKSRTRSGARSGVRSGALQVKDIESSGLGTRERPRPTIYTCIWDLIKDALKATFISRTAKVRDTKVRELSCGHDHSIL